MLDFNAERGRKQCIGKPSKNAEIVFTDEERRPIDATPDRPGLLASRGAMNMEGYWKNPELTAQTLVDGFVLTNDIGYFDADGFAYVTGRRDDVINYNGIKISPTEIEEIVLGFDGVAECACVGAPDPAAGQIPRLYVVAKDGAEIDMDAFVSFLRGRVDMTKMPKSVEVLDAFPRTYNGKLDRKALAAR